MTDERRTLSRDVLDYVLDKNLPRVAGSAPAVYPHVEIGELGIEALPLLRDRVSGATPRMRAAIAQSIGEVLTLDGSGEGAEIGVPVLVELLLGEEWSGDEDWDTIDRRYAPFGAAVSALAHNVGVAAPLLEELWDTRPSARRRIAFAVASSDPTWGCPRSLLDKIEREPN